VSVVVPVWLEGGLRIHERWKVGLYFVISPGIPGGALNSACSFGCTVFDVQLGLSADYHWLPGKTLDPWVGLGTGHEWLTIHTNSANPTAEGWTWLLLEAGIDLRGAGHLVYGPFVAATLGRYESFGDRYYPSTPSPPGLAMHEWLTLGVRAAYDGPFPQR
jgi:hypothetical protein